MKVVISHISAARYWTSDLAIRPAASACDETSFDSEEFAIRPSDIEMATSRLTVLGAGPLHVMLPHTGHSTSKLACHCHRGPLPPGSIRRLSEDVYIVSPELAFVQMGAEMPFDEHVKLGLRLCADYALRGGEIVQTSAPTSRRQIQRFVDRFEGRWGAKGSRRTLSYVADGSGSPMESHSTMLSCLPRTNGGYRFSLPELNRLIELDRATAQMVPQRYFKCDLYWPRQKVAIEYDSDAFHTGSDRIMADSLRRNALKHMGIKVTTVGRQQIMDSRMFDIVMRQIAKDLGRRIYEPFAPPLEAVVRLRNLLFSDVEFPTLGV